MVFCSKDVSGFPEKLDMQPEPFGKAKTKIGEGSISGGKIWNLLTMKWLKIKRIPKTAK